LWGEIVRKIARKIASVQICLMNPSSDPSVDPDQSKYKCDSVVSLDSSGAELKNYKELVGNAEYRSKHELILNVAYEIGVTTDVVSIMN